MSGGKEKNVAKAKKRLPDSRVQHFWDHNGEAMKAYKETLGIPRKAWDVYMLYKPGAKWDVAVPPLPHYWMHQLASSTTPNQPMEIGDYLDPDVFKKRTLAVLRPTP